MRERGRIGHALPTAPERLHVRLHLDTVQLDRLLDRPGGQRQGPGLERHPGQQHVRELVGAEQGDRQPSSIDENGLRAPGGAPDPVGGRIDIRERHRLVHDHLAGRHLRGRHHGNRGLRVRHGQVLGVRGHQQVTAEVEVALPRRGFVALLDLPRADLHVGDDRATLLGESGLIERTNLPARDPARGAQDLRQGHDSAAAHAGDTRGVRRCRDVEPERGISAGVRCQGGRRRPACSRLGTGNHGQERRAVALQA